MVEGRRRISLDASAAKGMTDVIAAHKETAKKESGPEYNLLGQRGGGVNRKPYIRSWRKGATTGVDGDWSRKTAQETK